ncbi:MAG: S8 family serine peptidase [Burkholderia sp.]
MRTDSNPSHYNGNNDRDEFAMDSQTIVGVSGGVNSLTFYNSPTWLWSDIAVALNRAVSDNTTKVISMSIGGDEQDTNPPASVMDQIFEAGIAQGQTFVISSGDNGAYSHNKGSGLFVSNSGGAPMLDANVGPSQLASYSVQYPESSPYVISVGATTLYTRSNSLCAWEEPMNWWYNFTVQGNVSRAPSLMWNDNSQSYSNALGNGWRHQPLRERSRVAATSQRWIATPLGTRRVIRR